MLSLLSRLKPVLNSVDDLVLEVPRPVTTEIMVRIFSSHMNVKIERRGITPELAIKLGIDGTHLGHRKDGKVVVVQKLCHCGFRRDCRGCQEERFICAKELTHIVDRDDEKTPPDRVKIDILSKIDAGEIGDGPIKSEFNAMIGALEILMPYRVRRLMYDGLSVSMAINTGDYKSIANQFCVPTELAEKAFSENHMKFMEEAWSALGMRSI